MNIQFYWDKLEDMKSYENFMDKNKEAYLCSAFFVLDFEGKDNKQHFDFYLPNEKKIESFEMENQGQKVPIDPLDERIPGPLNLKDFNFEFDEIKEIVEGALEKNKIKSKIQKIMASLQGSEEDNKPYMVCTVFLSGLGMANLRIDVQKKEVVFFEKKSLFNLFKT